ncbi:hydroxylamine reductase [Raphidocelis subcapitata]|uniref:Hydroxylamine reductase n=1 Tax=Raphidocelis subcapitata TaxID=307507 RepID=A0A2V0PED8_9CHLO|nr:hydroxylamine reductase [Raphidocelis subcapitata]|eukprot:GBF96263.1 hydroxylamine reductase [Raphidocelis subcapitata]
MRTSTKLLRVLGAGILSRGGPAAAGGQAHRPIFAAAAAGATGVVPPKGATPVATAPGRGFAAQPALAEETAMFCFQCEQTQDGTGCTTVGVCGKTPLVAGLQDLTMHSLKGLAAWALAARAAGVPDDAEVNNFINGSVFATLTNVNFDDARFVEMLHHADKLQARLAAAVRAKGGAPPTLHSTAELGWAASGLPHPAAWSVPEGASARDLEKLSRKAGVDLRRRELGPTLGGLQECLAYGIKGVAAYTHHAFMLGASDAGQNAAIQEALAFLASPQARDVGAVLDKLLWLGGVNLKTMQMLSDAHASRFGAPTPTEVPLTVRPGPCILVSGHDMADMEALLKATEGKGINIYTHGEMLPAHAYPKLKAHKHLAGHFGTAWQQQKREFALFPGPILATTNCVLEPPKSYKDRLFTTNEAGLGGVKHIGDGKDYGPLIAKALECEGFNAENMPEVEGAAHFTTGFGHQAILAVADQVIDAIKTGKLEHIFLIGGCDGAEKSRKYYSQLGSSLPASTMILTLGCAKYRINHLDFGNLPGTGLPRLLDMGQCNDAYGAIVVASELAKAFGCGVNDLPLSLDLSWFEQKAVAVLLTLLHLGIKNIRLGPKLPAFLTPEALGVLIERYNIQPASLDAPEEDLKRMMANK